MNLANTTAKIEAAMGAEVFFEPIWNTLTGRYDSYYAKVDDYIDQVHRMVPGATQEAAAASLLNRLSELHPERFEPTLAVAAE